MPSPLARKDLDLRALDILALFATLALLLVVFRRIERWLHQHIFKVGWLLCNNFQVTTILYYILFLPGILLHEITLWLAAGILRIRAERAIAFPARQEIGELRLNFIRLSPSSGRARRSLATLAPFAAGALCLWLVAIHVFNWRELAAIAAAGSIDALARAIARLTKTPDFWLWFYLAFTIANTMFPSSRQPLSGRQKGAIAFAAGASLMTLWRIGGATLSLGIESLLFSLALILLQTIFINIAVLLILGTLEAAIERLTGRSATFTDSKMITMSRKEAQAQKARQARERSAARQAPQAKQNAQIITSIYDMKLPIPGPPGREPVSRSAVSVITTSEAETDLNESADAAAKPASLPLNANSQPHRPPESSQLAAAIDSPAPLPAGKSPKQEKPRQQPRKYGAIHEASDGEQAPFSRPFALTETGERDSDSANDKASAAANDGYFPRPFAMRARADDDTEPGGQPSAEPQTDRKLRRARDELTYEPLDDEDNYLADDED